MRTLSAVFKTFRFSLKTLIGLSTIILFAGSLVLNSTFLFWQAGSLAVTGVLNTVTGLSFVIQDITAANTALATRNEALHMKNRTLFRTNRNLTTQSISQKSDIKELQGLSVKLREKNRNQGLELTGLRNSNETLNEKNKALNKQNETLITKNRTLTAGHAQLTKKNTDLEKLNGRFKKNTENVKALTTQISKRTARGAVRSTVTAFPQSIPLIGIFGVVVVTGWEVKDACDTLEDMDKINRIMGSVTDTGAKTVCGQKIPSAKDIYASIKSSPKQAWGKLKIFEQERDSDEKIPSWSEATEEASKPAAALRGLIKRYFFFWRDND